jgi:hypothetical protein
MRSNLSQLVTAHTNDKRIRRSATQLVRGRDRRLDQRLLY